jgi:K+-sensing histidine kinase KdpD
VSEARRHLVARLVAVAAPVAIAALLVPFRASFAATASALLLTTVVVAVAVSGDRVAGYVATISATLSFDVFLTQPYGRLAITHRPDLETAICLFAVGLAVTEISVRSRHHREVAIEEASYVGVLHEVTELVASGTTRDEIIEVVRKDLIDLLHLRNCRFELRAAERPRFQIESTGEVHLGGSVWGVQSLGLPGPEIELPVRSRGTPAGRFVLRPTPGLPVPRERLVVAVALADQVGATLGPQLRRLA